VTFVARMERSEIRGRSWVKSRIALRSIRATALLRHCLRQTRSVCARERSDEAIHLSLRGEMDCFAALAMTERHGLLRGARRHPPPSPRSASSLRRAIATSRANATSIVGRDFRPKSHRTARIVGPRAFNGLCDDEGVPLICPTCQGLAQSVGAGDRLLLCMGLFSIFFVGSHSDAAWLRESCLKPHTPARPSL
jgi:hypothetical protein